MKKLIRLLLIKLLTFTCVTTFSQTIDTLSIYPNPFSSLATIHFDIVQPDTITLRVFNVTGQTVRTFFQSTILPSGSYKINLLGDSLADGNYIIRLDIGSTKTISKKVFKIGSTSDIAENNTVKNIHIFPNPTNDRITIPIDGNKTIIVKGLNGRILKSFTTDQQSISLLDFGTGQYFITILTNQNEILTTQIILNRD